MKKIDSTKMETIKGGRPIHCWSAAIFLGGVFLPGGGILATSCLVSAL